MVTVLFAIKGYSYSKSINAKSVFLAQTHLNKRNLNTLKQRLTYRLTIYSQFCIYFSCLLMLEKSFKLNFDLT